MSLPYFPFFVSDFDADTMHLTAEQDGVYNRLLRLQWKNKSCALKNDERDLRTKLRLTAAQYRRSAIPVIREYFLIEDGYIYNNRLREEWEKANRKHRRRVEAGKKGALQKASNARAELGHCSSNQNQNHKGTLSSKREPRGLGDTREGDAGPFAQVVPMTGRGDR